MHVRRTGSNSNSRDLECSCFIWALHLDSVDHCRCHWPTLGRGKVPPSDSGPPRHRAHGARDHRNRDAHHHRAQLHRAAAGSPPRGPRPATTAATGRDAHHHRRCPITPRCFTLPPHRAAAPATTATRALTTTVPNAQLYTALLHAAAPRRRARDHCDRGAHHHRAQLYTALLHAATPCRRARNHGNLEPGRSPYTTSVPNCTPRCHAVPP